MGAEGAVAPGTKWGGGTKSQWASPGCCGCIYGNKPHWEAQLRQQLACEKSGWGYFAAAVWEGVWAERVGPAVAAACCRRMFISSISSSESPDSKLVDQPSGSDSLAALWREASSRQTTWRDPSCPDSPSLPRPGGEAAHCARLLQLAGGGGRCTTTSPTATLRVSSRLQEICKKPQTKCLLARSPLPISVGEKRGSWGGSGGTLTALCRSQKSY